VSDLRDAMRAAKAARDSEENQNVGMPEDNNTDIPVNQNTGIADIPKGDDAWANLAIRVTKRQRLHWLIEAKKQRTSLTAAIIEALNARFGKPSDE
jgi:hypothetical protein